MSIGEYDVPKETAEKVIKNLMSVMQNHLDKSVPITDDLARDVFDRLGIIAMGMARLYSNELDYQKAIGVVARDNIRLSDTIAVLADELSDAHKIIVTLTPTSVIE
jgi:hypothetical protein